MERLRHFLFVRYGHNWLLLLRFGVVGFSGVFVNLPGTIIAFLVANLWNFQLNRAWTFRSAKHWGWLREYLPFLTVGLLAQIVGLGILTLLMHPQSPLGLSPEFFDDSTGFRTRLYWAQLITIGVVTPVSFVLNKIWTFSAVRGKNSVAGSATAELDPEHTPAPTPQG